MLPTQPSQAACAERIAEAGVRRVWIGCYDPNPRIHREGWRLLRESGVEVRDFAPELRAEIVADNQVFLDQFRTSKSGSGEAYFDHTINNGLYVIEAGAHRFTSKWSTRGNDTVWAYGDLNPVADARYAKAFTDVDDPAALDYSGRCVAAATESILSFRSDRAYLLVRILEVHDRERGADRTELKLAWELRAPPPATRS